MDNHGTALSLMNFNWKKHGLIFTPDHQVPWQQSHAALPTHYQIKDSLYRIFFASRDKNNHSHIGSFDVDLNQPDKILHRPNDALLSPGAKGEFDEWGVMPSCSIQNKNKLFLYYIGWQKGQQTEKFETAIGLAISSDQGKSFSRYSSTPILQRSKYDPWMVSGASVFPFQNTWQMLYISGIRCEQSPNGDFKESLYDVKWAQSNDGLVWQRNGKIALPLEAKETNISRPSIIYWKEKYHCWYPVKKRSEKYRMGYAHSENGKDWIRQDSLAGLSVSDSGWDSEALDKFNVILYQNKLYLFYNGNDFGREGIGLATCQIGS